MSVLVTGAGAVSRAIASELLRRGAGVVMWSHAGSPRGLPAAERLEHASGDLRRDDAFHGVDASPITHVVHAAALTRFDAAEGDAQAVNVEGTRRLVEWAARAPRLQSLLFVSSVHAAGLRRGVVEEHLLPDDAAHANAYERSKAHAERVVATSGLPWRIARLGTVLCGDERGGLVQENALHLTLRLLRAGVLPLLPGAPECPVHLVTTSAAATTCVELLLAGEGVAHVTAPARLAPSLHDVLTTAHDALRAAGDPRLARLPMPLLVDRDAFADLLAGSDGLLSPATHAALRCLAPFAAQLHAPKRFLTQRAEGLSAGALDVDPLPLLRRVAGSLPAPRRAPSTEALP